MIFGRKDSDTDGGSVHATALVVDAAAPAIDGDWGGNPAMVQVLVDAGSGPALLQREFKLTKSKWLVAGMEVPVAIDPGKPDRFKVDWEAVPDIEDRAAANDPALADPVGASAKVASALESAGLPVTGRAASAPPPIEEALERAASEPAPPGKVRAVVLIPTIRGHVDPQHKRQTSVGGKSPAVLAVNVPGKAPYAVYAGGFKVPGKRWDVAGSGLPALVSASDPNDVEVLWDELPSIETGIGARISAGMQEAQAGLQADAAMGRQMMDALQQPGAGPQPAMPAAGGAANEALGPMRDMMIANAKSALQMVSDPAVREMMIKQYRAAGIPIDEGDQTP
jgi:hypothetical protein